MSPKAAAKRWDKRLRDGWATQRSRADAWENRPYPELEWPEVRGFLATTASTLTAVVGTASPIEQDLIHLLGSYLARETSPSDYPPGETANQAWTNLRQAQLKGPFIEVLGRLHAYAVIGTWLDDDLPGEAEVFVDRVEEDLRLLEGVLDSMPKVNASELGRESSLTLQMLRDIARARLAVDEGCNSAPAAGVGWLGRVSSKTILNMLSKGQLKSGGPATVDARSARSWLSGREWSRSCWREAIEVISGGMAAPFQDADGQGDVSPPAGAEEERTDWVFVPRAVDGSLFVPELVRAHGWTVGVRGSERSFGDYWRALSFLQDSARPSWRRPNEHGAYNIVAGKDWVRTSRAELDLQLKMAEAGRSRP